VEIDDLAVLVRSKPGGRVSTKLAWEVLDAEDFVTVQVPGARVS
jgi:hypothetical protein